jgi:sorbitol-specific phosphotransferase system component IIBC
MRWTLGGIAAGIAVAMLIIMAVETIGNQLYPPPRGFDMAAGSSVNLPFATLIFPVIGWFLGARAGAWLATHLSGHAWAGWALAGLVLLATLLNLVLITHPLWMIIAGIVAPILGGLIGQRLGARRLPRREV